MAHSSAPVQWASPTSGHVEMTQQRC